MPWNLKRSCSYFNYNVDEKKCKICFGDRVNENNSAIKKKPSRNPYNGWTTYAGTKDHFAAKFNYKGETNGAF